tara:strand:+ start:2385 stop:4394 length:2010 start_codon:yes stop_codon:yes gene_type:complete
MAFNTVGDIKEVISLAEANMADLSAQMEDDFELLTLVEYEPEDTTGKTRKGYQSYTSSKPRNFFDKVLDGLNRAALTIEIVLPEDSKEKERRAASVGELYLWGALAEIDRRLERRGEPSLRESIGFLMCARGWYAMRALVYRSKDDKETVFDVQPWDPLHTTWEQGADGLLWAARKRKATKAQIEFEYGVVITGQDTEVIDFWDAERNAVIIDGDFAKEPTEHNIGHVPVGIGAVGSMPTIQSKDFESTLQYRGDSVWSSSRGLYRPQNKYISWIMDTAARSVAGSLVYESKDGTKTVEGDPYGTFKVLPLAQGERIYPLELPKVPPEVAAVLGIMNDDTQQSTLPYPLAYGGTKEAMSGRALSVLADATRSAYSPRTTKMATAYKWLCEELLAQYAIKGTQTTDMKGYKRDGRFFKQQVKPSEIDNGWIVNVTVEPRMPRDEEAEVMMALAATQRRGPEDIPLMSKQTARENILQIRDPDSEEDKALAEMGKTMLPVMGPRIAKAMKDRGDDEGAEIFMAWLASQGLFKGPGQQGGGPSRQMGGVPPGAAPEAAPQAAPQGAAPPPIPPELVEAILQALMDEGQQDIGQAFAAVNDGQAPLTPELIEAIIQVLVGSGKRELAAALLQALGVAPPRGAQGMPPPAPPRGTPPPPPPQAPPGIPMGPPVG